MDPNPKRPPAVIFGLEYHQHRVLTVVEFLLSTKALVDKKSRKSILLSHVAAQEKTLFTSDEREQISAWFRDASSSPAITKIISPILGDHRFTKFECSVCMILLPSYFFPQGKLAQDCDHKSSACVGCLSQSLDRDIKGKPCDQVACPECPAKLDLDTIKQFATAESLLRYERQSVLETFEGVPNFMMCVGPNCLSGQLHEGGADQPIMTCTTCKYKSCFTHKAPWHSGLSCAEYDAREAKKTRQDAKTQTYLAKRTKICPNIKCGLNLDKYTGCDHVKCTKCHYEFCWMCFASYKEILRRGNDAHEPSCKWHTSRVGTGRAI